MLNEVFYKNASSQGRFRPVFLPMLRGVHVNVVIRRPCSGVVAHKSHINLPSAAANSCTEGERRSRECHQVNIMCQCHQPLMSLPTRCVTTTNV